MLHAYTRSAYWLRARLDPQEDRGDVPGWVMVTLMTALIVAALLTTARTALLNMFNQAMAAVHA